MKVLKPADNGRGYLHFVICSNGERIDYTIHRFVFECIVGPIPKTHEIDHCDSDPRNNTIKNLPLLTHAENIQKAKSKKVIAVNLENDDERIFISIKIAGEKLGINYQNILAICRKCKHHKSATSN